MGKTITSKGQADISPDVESQQPGAYRLDPGENQKLRSAGSGNEDAPYGQTQSPGPYRLYPGERAVSLGGYHTSKQKDNRKKEENQSLRMASASAAVDGALLAPQPLQNGEDLARFGQRTGRQAHYQVPQPSMTSTVTSTSTNSTPTSIAAGTQLTREEDSDATQSFVIAKDATTLEDYEADLIGRMQGQLEGVLEQQVEQELERRMNSVVIAEPVDTRDELSKICGLPRKTFLLLSSAVIIVVVIAVVAVIISGMDSNETQPANETKPPLNLNGTCGDGFVGNGICVDGSCCSEFGYCGTTNEHCKPVEDGEDHVVGTCGDGVRGNGICEDNRFCCSEFGYCGTTDAHCSYENKAFGPCGDGIVGNGICKDGSCCSSFGYCGTTEEFCSNDDVINANNNGNGNMTNNVNCGSGIIGNGICVDGSCCSKHGFCGTTDEHCGGE